MALATTEIKKKNSGRRVTVSTKVNVDTVRESAVRNIVQENYYGFYSLTMKLYYLTNSAVHYSLNS